MEDSSRRGGRGGSWNVWTSDRRSDDRPLPPNPDSAYTDRRGDAPSRREYDSRFGPSRSSYDDFQESRSPENLRDDRFKEATTRRASFHEPSTTFPNTKPRISRNSSFHGITNNGVTGSPARSPASATSSMRSDPRLQKDDAVVQTKRDAIGESSGPKVTDPRLRMVNGLSGPGTRAPNIALKKKKETGPPAVLNMSLDGSSEEMPGSNGVSAVSASRDVSLAGGNQSVANTVVDTLLRFMEPAVSSGIHQHGIERLEEALKKAKEDRDKASKQPKLPLVMTEAHRVTYEQAAEEYTNASKELAEVQLKRTLLATDFFMSLGTFIRDTSAQEIQNSNSQDASGQVLWQQNITAAIESFEKQLESVRASNNASDAINLLESNQKSLQQIIQEAQPRFEKTIDFLNKKSKDQQAEITTLRAENTTIKTEMTEVRQQMQKLDDTFRHRLEQLVTRSEFDAHKAHVTSFQVSLESATAEQAKMKAEVQALSARIVILRQIFENKVRLPSPQVQPRDNGGGQLSDIQSQLNSIKSEMQSTSSRISDLSSAEQTGRDAMHLCKDVKSQLQALQTDLEAVQQSNQMGEQSTTQQLQQHSLSTTDDVQKIEEKVLDVARQTAALNSEVEVLRREIHLSISAGNGEGPNRAESPATADKFKRLFGHVGGLKSEIQRIDELRHGNAVSIKALEVKVEQSQGSAATERKLTELSGKLEDVSNRPTTLTTKERMLLNTLDSTTKRVNDLENTVFDLVKDDSHNINKAQTQYSDMSVVRLNEIKERLDGLQANYDRLNDEAKQKASGREAELSQLKKYYEDGVSAMARSIDQAKTGLKANEHSLQSLTSRYNNLTSEKIARQIADIVQPAVKQLQREQIDMQTQYVAIETNLAKLKKSSEALNEKFSDQQSSAEVLNKVMETVREGFVEGKDFHDLQKTLLTFTNRISKLEDIAVSTARDKSASNTKDAAAKSVNEHLPGETWEEVSNSIISLTTQLVQGRDALQAEQKAHEDQLKDLDYRLKKLEGRVASVNDWAPDDEDEESSQKSSSRKDSSQKDGFDLLQQFGPHYTPAPRTADRAASRPSAPSASARFSPASTTASDKEAATTRAPPTGPKVPPTSQEIPSTGLSMPSTWPKTPIGTPRLHLRVGPAQSSSGPKDWQPGSLTSTIEPLGSLASRIEAPQHSSQGSLRRKRSHMLSDSDDDFHDDTVIVESSGGLRSSKKKKKGKKAPRFQ